MVLTCGCKEGVEVDVNDVPHEVRARASCERGLHGRCFDRDTMRRGQGRLILESWRRRWYTQLRKNSVSGSWVDASAKAALCQEAWSRCILGQSGAGLRTRREGFGEDAPLE